VKLLEWLTDYSFRNTELEHIMHMQILLVLSALAAAILLSGCAVVASPHHAGVYVAPIPIFVSPVIVQPRRGDYGRGHGHGHWRRW
jgi:hypothetical protein